MFTFIVGFLCGAFYGFNSKQLHSYVEQLYVYVTGMFTTKKTPEVITTQKATSTKKKVAKKTSKKN